MRHYSSLDHTTSSSESEPFASFCRRRNLSARSCKTLSACCQPCCKSTHLQAPKRDLLVAAGNRTLCPPASVLLNVVDNSRTRVRVLARRATVSAAIPFPHLVTAFSRGINVIGQRYVCVCPPISNSSSSDSSPSSAHQQRSFTGAPTLVQKVRHGRARLVRIRSFPELFTKANVLLVPFDWRQQRFPEMTYISAAWS